MSQRKIIIQICSDMHLELTKSIPYIPPLANYLFLAGDIGRINNPLLQEFLTYCNNNWEKTFYVFGNHDYWYPRSYIQKIKRQQNSWLQKNKLTNIHILDNQFVSVNEELIVFGSTFWTQSPFVSNDEARLYINDYNMIKYKQNIAEPRPYDLTPKDVNAMYMEDSTSIYKCLNNDELTKSKKVIVLTHFPPQQSNTSHPKFNSQSILLKKYYAHPDDKIKEFDNISNIVCWISGHTHYSYDFISSDKIRLISNQMGYTNEQTLFKNDLLFEINY